MPNKIHSICGREMMKWLYTRTTLRGRGGLSSFTNWKGERKQTQKRGFATKREAQAWEHEAMLKQGAKLDNDVRQFL